MERHHGSRWQKCCTHAKRNGRASPGRNQLPSVPSVLAGSQQASGHGHKPEHGRCCVRGVLVKRRHLPNMREIGVRLEARKHSQNGTCEPDKNNESWHGHSKSQWPASMSSPCIDCNSKQLGHACADLGG